MNSEWAKLVLPVTETTRALQERDDLANVVADIDVVVESSSAGAQMLGRAQRMLAYMKVQNLIDRKLTELGRGNCTVERVQEKKNNFSRCALCSASSRRFAWRPGRSALHIVDAY